MINKIKPYLIIILVIANAVLLAMNTGCQSAPKRKDYRIKPCYHWSVCMYRNKDNKDKSACAGFAVRCDKISVYEYCKKEKNFQQCWDKLR